MEDHPETKLTPHLIQFKVDRMYRTLYGNGEKGLDQVAREFFARWEEREDARLEAEKRRGEEMKAIDRKWNMRAAIITVILIAAGLLWDIFGPAIRRGLNLPVAAVPAAVSQQDSGIPGSP